MHTFAACRDVDVLRDQCNKHAVAQAQRRCTRLCRRRQTVVSSGAGALYKSHLAHQFRMINRASNCRQEWLVALSLMEGGKVGCAHARVRWEALSVGLGVVYKASGSCG